MLLCLFCCICWCSIVSFSLVFLFRLYVRMFCFFSIFRFLTVQVHLSSLLLYSHSKPKILLFVCQYVLKWMRMSIFVITKKNFVHFVSFSSCFGKIRVKVFGTKFNWFFVDSFYFHFEKAKYWKYKEYSFCMRIKFTDRKRRWWCYFIKIVVYDFVFKS